MPVKRAFLSTLIPLVALAAVGTAFAAQQFTPQSQQGAGTSIAAVVNEDVITLFDVQSRVGLIMATSGMENTPDMQRRILPQVIDSLIEERLKSQEARRLKINTSEAELRQAVENIEQRNNMPPGAFRSLLETRGIDMGSLYSQIEADVAWVKVVRQELQRTVTVAPEEVNTVLDRLKANQGKPEYLLAEISLPVNTAAQEQAVQQLANQLVEQARGGKAFPQLAQQFSQSPTAAVGGDLGWVISGDLEPELNAAVTRLEKNQISNPIRTSTGYHILTLRDVRSAGTPDPGMAAITLSQIYLPTEGGRALDEQRLEQLSESIRAATSCEQMNKLAEEIATPGSGPIPPIYVASLPDAVRNAVITLKPGQVSQPINVPGAILFAMVCIRRDDTGVPSADQVYANLENEKLQNAARQRLRDLRRQALVDVRL
jgi:peptidyl-prolyl cis-trans isomerase SurA